LSGHHELVYGLDESAQPIASVAIIRQGYEIISASCIYNLPESYFMLESWSTSHRFIFIRKQVRCQDKAPLQLDLYRPTEYGYDFKVIVTNKRSSPRKIVAFHNRVRKLRSDCCTPDALH
jgi:hypothetical protein